MNSFGFCLFKKVFIPPSFLKTASLGIVLFVDDFILSIFWFFIFLKFLLFMLLQLSQFPTLPTLYPVSPSHSQSPHHCSCPWVMNMCSLSSSFTSFTQSQHTPAHSYSCQSVPCFCVSDSILLVSLFCSLYYSYK